MFYYRYSTLPYEGLIICCLTILNFILVVSDNKLRHNEIPSRIYVLLKQLESMLICRTIIIYFIYNSKIYLKN